MTLTQNLNYIKSVISFAAFLECLAPGYDLLVVEWLAELALNAEDLGYIPGKPSTGELAVLILIFFWSQHNQDWGKITQNLLL